jgi:integrase
MPKIDSPRKIGARESTPPEKTGTARILRVFDPEEIENVAAAIWDRKMKAVHFKTKHRYWVTLIVLALQWATGARGGEIMFLGRKDFTGKEILVRRQKVPTVKKDLIGINRDCINLLNEYLVTISRFTKKVRDPFGEWKKPLLPNIYGNFYGGKSADPNVRRRNALNTINNYLTEFSLPVTGRRMTTHDFRRSKALYMQERGSPVTDIKAILGHRSVKTTYIYLETSKEPRTRQKHGDFDMKFSRPGRKYRPISTE